MYGAILGDMIGSPFEFDRGNKTKDFTLLTRQSEFTDDSVMTAAVAEALMKVGEDASYQEIKKAVTKSMQSWGRKYPYAGYGARFIHWIFDEDPKPYDSYGNGSAMRVSAAGWLYDSLEKTRLVARATAEVSHNHPQGIIGAEATASVIYLARTGAAKEEIRQYVIDSFGYDLGRTVDEIRPDYYHVESCQQTVPEAITCFMEGTDYEDVIRTAISLGGDTDTLGAIAGAMAEAFYGVPDHLKEECRRRLPGDLLEVVKKFEEFQMLAREKDPRNMVDRWSSCGYGVSVNGNMITPETILEVMSNKKDSATKKYQLEEIENVIEKLPYKEEWDDSLTNESIKFLSMAEGGAMGSPNEVCIAAVQEGVISWYSVYPDEKEWDKLERIFPVFESLQCTFGGGYTTDLPEAYAYVDLGAGNHLFMKSEYEEEFQKALIQLNVFFPPQKYRYWRGIAKRILEDVYC